MRRDGGRWMEMGMVDGVVRIGGCIILSSCLGLGLTLGWDGVGCLWKQVW